MSTKLPEHLAFDSKGVPFFDGARVRYKGRTFLVEAVRTPHCFGDEKGMFGPGKDRYSVALVPPAKERGMQLFEKPFLEVWEGERVRDAQILNPSEKPEERNRAMPKRQASKKAERKIAGRTTGLPVDLTWQTAFERAAKEKWTDDQITRFMKSEFPDRKSKIFETGVQRVRTQYNRGKLNGQTRKPAKPLERYEKNGSKKETSAPAKRRVVVVKKS